MYDRAFTRDQNEKTAIHTYVQGDLQTDQG